MLSRGRKRPKDDNSGPVNKYNLTRGTANDAHPGNHPFDTMPPERCNPVSGPRVRPLPVPQLMSAHLQTEVAVLGSGPGGYAAAFRAADLGKKTMLIERYPTLGGVCLNVGCIPSKALLHTAAVLSEAKAATAYGIDFGVPQVNREKLLGWKNQVLSQLTGGLQGLARQRKVTLVRGTGRFAAADRLVVDTDEGERIIEFENAVIATGSRPIELPGCPDDPRIMDSTGALELAEIPARMLIIGGGIIGLEMATVYHELGSKITVVEALDRLMVGADPDIVTPLRKRVTGQYENIYLSARVSAIEAREQELLVSFDGAAAPSQEAFDRVLVAIGRRPNGGAIGADKAGVRVDEHGFIPVDDQQRTSAPNIYAIGDVVGNPMLAHKATHEGKVAAEVIAGHKRAFDDRLIPAVAYTDPEVAWVGLTETEAKEQGRKYGKGVFPWAASGRSLCLGRGEGLTKLLFDEDSKRVIGAGIVGANAGDLIAEAALAIEMGCQADDVGLTIHPHPTLAETIAGAAEIFAGTITDLYAPRQ